MIFPQEIKIGNRTVKVSIEPIPPEDNLMGFYDPTNFRIVINQDLSPANAVETFWHEMMHAIMDFNRFENEVVSEMQRAEAPNEAAFNIEERTAENFAKTLLQVIQDNNLFQLTTP